MGTFYSGAAGNTLNSGVSLDSTRRKFNFGERVAELAPVQSPFFVYLSKVAKKATNDPVFKFLEQRHQWQRRNFTVDTTVAGSAWDTGAEAAGTACDAGSGDLYISCKYDKYGRITSADNPCYFILPGQVIAVVDDDGDVRKFRIDADATVTTVTTDYTDEDNNGKYISHLEHSNDLSTVITAESLIPLQAIAAGDSFANGNKGQVIGSAWAEGTDSPVGWEDKLYDREGYCQIFKTGMNIFSGTALATEYRGIANEFQRIWQDKLMEHKMDIEQAMLFGIGSASNETSTSTAPVRTTWGLLPYTESYGKIYNMSYSSSGYDAFLDAMEDFFAPESGNSGNKLVLASRKVITYLNKLGSGSFLNNSVGSSQYRLDVATVPGAFGHTVTVVNTIFGNLHFVQEPLLRGPWEDYCVAVDMKNVAYRPLSGNGVSRDTFIETNIQDPGVDGRQDQIITEAGLEISVPETHAILKFS
jgi:hypothetical protein